MKKNFTLFVLLTCLATMLHGQSTYKTFSDNFESYSNNDWLALNSSVWDTWSSSPGSGSDDVQVSNGDSYSGSNSIYFNAGPGPEDVILPFGGVYRRGQFVYKAMMKIPSSKSAYFNFQADAAVGVTWALEVTFRTDSQVVFSNTSSTMYTGSYPQGKWFEIEIYVNLTKNQWHVYIDNEYRGYFANSINRVSYLDLYPADRDASFWVDDVSFIYAPPSPNNAGIERLISPIKAICGKNDIEVMVVNNGSNKLDSVRVNWKMDGVLQSPVFVKTAIDTINSTAGNTLDVTLDSTFLLSKGLHNIEAWTSHPNGVADTLNFDDTLKTSFVAEVSGVGVAYSKPYQGKKGRGTAAWPDTVCASDTITYELIPPTGYTNADIGTGWTIKSLNIKSNGVAPKDTLTLRPSGNNGYRLRYMADTSESNSVFKVEVGISVGSGCDTVVTHYFFVSPIPHVAFTANDACLGKLTRFVNTSNGGGKNDYLWNFGDKTGSRFIGTSKRYTSTGTYDVTLRATAPSGCKATTSQSISVFDIPEPKFSVLDACDSSNVVFADSSIIANGSITKYFWDFGDGDTSVLKNATHLYNGVGTYDVRLTVTSDEGCTDKIDGQATVYPAPDAAFTAMDGCQPDTLMFSNASTYSGKDALNYEWSFGDGNSSVDKNPSYNYGAAGSYSVKMKVITTNGCTDSATMPVQIYAVPEALFSADNNCLGEETVFTNNSSISAGTITSYNWSLRQGNKSTAKDPVVEYTSAGTLSVELIVVGTGGCSDTISQDVEIYPLPKAGFAAENVCQDVALNFENESKGQSDTLEFVWNFGDGNSSTDETASNVFSQDGTYEVELLVTTENGCVDTAKQSVEIYALPDVGFTFSHMGFGRYTFTPNNADLQDYQWDFGDGNTSTDVSPYHEFDTEGDYDVTLSATGDNSCVGQELNNVSVSTSIAGNGASSSPLKVFPNPFKDQVTITYELQKASKVSVEIYALSGKRLENIVSEKQLTGKYQYTFETPDASGIYMVRMVVDGNVFHQRVVKTQ